MQKIPLPKLLQEIPDPPSELYIRGALPFYQKNIFLTVVGSRKYTPYGKQSLELIIKGLSGYPFVIVSGLALGIDTLAHSYALKYKLPCIAVPGSGLNDKVLYPKSNYHLAQQILNSGGCLLSEYDPDFKATPWSFPKRNRIMAGLSHAVLVIEAENISGTRITASLATQYNREVLAVPGSIFSKQSEGTNRLIQEGSVAVTSAEDIIEYFNLSPLKAEQKKIPKLNPEQQSIYDLLDEPRSRNYLSQNTNSSIREINRLLSLMEIEALVRDEGGKIYRML